MPTFSFDVVSDYDKAEMNNVFDQVQREIASRFDFKGTPAAIDWLDDKKGFKITGAGEWQVENIIEIVRKKLASRNQSSKVLNLEKPLNEANLKATKDVPFIAGLDQDKAKQVSKLVRDALPKLKPQIQGEAVRIIGSSKDDLQQAITLLKGADLAYPLQFENYR
jgi:cyclic-di-GMP-binding protein